MCIRDSYWTVRYCALHILANTLEQTKDRPEYECFYTRAFETVKNNEKDNDRKTKIPVSYTHLDVYKRQGRKYCGAG